MPAGAKGCAELDGQRMSQASPEAARQLDWVGRKMLWGGSAGVRGTGLKTLLW